MTEQQPEPDDTGTDQQPEAEGQEQPSSSRQDRRDQHTRERLREVEAERDALQSRLDARDRAAVEAEAKRVLGDKGAHLFRLGDVAEVRDPETGDVDEELLAERLRPIREALDEHQHSHHGDMGPRRTAKSKDSPGWGDFIRGRR